MSAVKRVLLVVSDEFVCQEAVSRALRIAVSAHADVTVMAIAERVTSGSDRSGLDVNALVARDLGRRIESIAELLSTHGVSAEPKTRAGAPFEEIVREVEEGRVDLVVLMSDSAETDGTNHRELASRLMRKCPCPVLVVTARERERYELVVAAVDPADDRPECDIALDERILQLANFLAKADDAKLLVVHAWPGTSTGPFVSVNPEEAEAARLRHVERLQKLMARPSIADIVADTQLVSGHPSVAIPRTVEGRRGDVLVMGSVARSGIRGLFMGNTAERVVNAVRCSVATVKPAGFGEG